MLQNGWVSASPVQIYVQRCCEPSLGEPNYALNLELAEYITQKKANTPREAATAVAAHINHRNPHVAILAIALLRTLVQTVGYPFQLQIGTKEFLNELVRRFPERPPPFPGPVMSRILELIHEWRETICKDSRWKEDMGNIRDMHRLLTYKGYRFKDSTTSSSYLTAANANLKSPEELENEDREAQQAKLQELIRRGTPRDLAKAQELMKSLAGANPDAKPDYRSQTLNELEKLQAKVILLNDLLDNVDTTRGENFVTGDAYEQVATVCAQARPKIQKWISDASGEGDDPGESDSLETFLSINDLINNVLERYERYKKGDYTAHPMPEQQSSTAGGGKTDLINFDMEDAASPVANAPATTKSGSAADDLAELFGPPTTSKAPAHVSSFNLFSSTSASSPSQFPSAGYGFNGQTATQQQQQIPPAFGFGFGGGAAPPLMPFGHTTPPPGAGYPSSSSSGGLGPNTMLGGIALPTTPNNPRSMTPASRVSPAPSGMGMGAQQQQQAQTPGQDQAKNKGKDPFADLVGLF